MDDIRLVFCSSKDVVEFETRHYVAKMPKNYFRATEHSKPAGKPRGHHGQQIHFLIWYKGENVGAISGGSAVFATRIRDNFFGLNKNNRIQTINGIIDNTLFRLENHEPNLATRVLSRWRHSVVEYWKYLYDVTPYGFETFVEFDDISDDTRPNRQRVGCLYKADNWTFVGETCGSTKNHLGVGLTGGRTGGKGSFARESVSKKLVFCKWIKGFNEPQYCEYKSSWKAGTKEGTPAEKALAKERTERRKRCIGTSSLSEALC
jgi:hypothetical protein